MNDWVVLEPMHWTTLVSAEELIAALGQPGLAIIDARASLADPLQGDRDYAVAHIPGAVHANLERDLSDHSRKGHGRHPLPDAHTFCRWLELWGITPAHQVVIYDARDGAMAAARVWFMLRLLGHQHVAVLDGGLARWRDLHLPISDLPATPSASTYEADYDTTRLVEADALRDMRHRDASLLVDARAPERFRGEVEPIDRIAGHVPGAVNHPSSTNLRADGRFLPASKLAAAFRAVIGTREPSQVVAMCGSGVTACHNLLAMEHAGLRGARLYADSWSGWIEDPSRPVARG